MTERAGLNRNLSMRSDDTQPSIATTDILLRGSADDLGGPLRSHPVTMLGSIPQSLGFHTDSEMASLDTPAASVQGSEGEASEGSPAILAPFRDEFIHGQVQYASIPMRYVTKLDDPSTPEAGEATLEDARPKSSSKTKHMSWMGLGSFGRQKKSNVSSVSSTLGAGDWKAPKIRQQETRVVSMPLMPDGDGSRWDWEEYDEDSAKTKWEGPMTSTLASKGR